MIDIILFFILTFVVVLTVLNSRFGKASTDAFLSSRLDRIITAAIVAGIVMCGWTKGPVVNPANRHISQYILALVSGGIRDDSGVVAEQTQLNTVNAYIDLAAAMMTDSSNQFVSASIIFDNLADQLTNNPTPVVYIQSFYPREDPYVSLTNHNLAVLAMTQSSTSNVLSRWIYFSEDLVSEPTLYAEADVGGGYLRLTETTNTYPNTELKDGVPCVRYDYALPAGMQGVVFSPDFDLRFGSEENGLQIGSGGLEIVDTNNVSHLGADEWISICSNRVEVLHRGGVAVRVKIDGQIVTNGVYTL
ncbi:MAG: hypothetical protein PF904_10925 [Kiritimatiellae bacterium]|jgi:hypothetical protein|nr:hypothetical protein [Kiritimatiellia bacterium]